jgi:raffinose/stachyose/melibiose transport system permease protein
MRNANKIVIQSLITITLLVMAAFFFLPIYMALVNSFKTQKEIFHSVLALPTVFNFDNYSYVLNSVNLFQSLSNSVIITVIGVGGMLLFGSMAGYRLSRTPGKLSSFVFFLFLSSMMIPFHVIMITLTQVAKHLSLQSSTYGLGLIYIGLGMNMVIFLYHGFVKGIPKEMEEAARIDGAGEMYTFFRIILPLLKPITVTLAIINILWIWNDFLLPLLMLTNVNKYTLILMTNMFFGQYTKDWGSILSSLVITAIPVVAFFVVFQKWILQGIADGALKG